MNALIPEVQPGEMLVIRVDGNEEKRIGRASIQTVEKLIGARCLDTVNLRVGDVIMMVDDQGVEKQLLVNARATELYHSVCKPGTSWPIRGDVVLVNDGDFA